MKNYKIILIFILGNILHISFLKLNEILKIADSFAYLQMSYYFNNFSIEGFGNGWFGFLYSLPIAFIDNIFKNDMISAFAINIILFNILVYLCFNFGKKYLQNKYNYLFIILLFLSPILLHYNINILSENIFIPLFMILFIKILEYKDKINFKNTAILSFILSLLYYTRGESFIYIGSIILIILSLFISKNINFKTTILNIFVLIGSFFIFIFPYIFYLHSFTGDWGLTNKGSSNLRQAELRGISKMDDDGFEQAVGELREDNHGLIAGFAGGLKYEKPQKNQSFKNYILKNPYKIINRISKNQAKLYSLNIPKLISGDAINLYYINGSKLFYKNILFLIFSIIPIILLIWGIISLIKDKKYYFLFCFSSFFLTASLFFTLFFVLDRYFVIFVPVFVFFIVFGLQNIKYKMENIKFYIFSLILICIYSLGLLSYFNTFKSEDLKYEIKKIAGIRLSENKLDNSKIMERFPIVTYYSNVKERWLTPYTDNIENLIEYANFKNITYLVVDNVDFEKYRPGLVFLLKEPKNYNGLELVKIFEKDGGKVIIYKFTKK